MNSLVKWLLVPSVVLLGMAFVATSQAEARRWVRYYRPVPAVTYVAPAPVYVPAPVYAPAPAAVHVDAPGVSVDVARPVRVYPYGPTYVAPPRIITPWFQMW